MTEDKLIVYGTVIRKDGSIQDIYYVYELEEGSCCVGVAAEGMDGLVYVNEPYDFLWRRKTDRRGGTYTEKGYKS